MSGFLTYDQYQNFLKKYNLKEDQLKEYIRIFQMFARDKNGCIDRSDLIPVIRGLGQNPTEQEAINMISIFDTLCADQRVEFEMILLFMKENAKERLILERELVEAFKVFDKSGTGKIHKAQLESIMTTIGDRITKLEFEDMMKGIYVDKNNEVDYRAFVENFTKHVLELQNENAQH